MFAICYFPFYVFCLQLVNIPLLTFTHHYKNLIITTTQWVSSNALSSVSSSPSLPISSSMTLQSVTISTTYSPPIYVFPLIVRMLELHQVLLLPRNCQIGSVSTHLHRRIGSGLGCLYQFGSDCRDWIACYGGSQVEKYQLPVCLSKCACASASACRAHCQLQINLC